MFSQGPTPHTSAANRVMRSSGSLAGSAESGLHCWRDRRRSMQPAHTLPSDASVQSTGESTSPVSRCNSLVSSQGHQSVALTDDRVQGGGCESGSPRTANLYLPVQNPIVWHRKRRFVGGFSEIHQFEKRRHGLEYLQGPWPPILKHRVPEGALEMRLPIEQAAHEQDVVFIWSEGTHETQEIVASCH
jgi:hypothetical protein